MTAHYVLTEWNGCLHFAKDYAEIPVRRRACLGTEYRRIEITEEEAKWPLFSLMLILIQRGKLK